MDMMKVWVGTTQSGQQGQTRTHPLECQTDVRQEDQETVLTAKCFFNDLFSRNPTVTEDESMKSAKNNRRTLVEQWWYSSSGGSEQLSFTRKWSAGLKPTVFHKTLQVNLEGYLRTWVRTV